MRRGDGLYLRGSTWRLDFYHEGKRHIVTLGRNISKTVAREIASVKRGAILKGEAGIGKKPKDIALKKAVELYLAWVGANRRANTLRFHKECLGALEKHFGTKRLGDISESQVEAYKQGRVKNGRGMVAANRQLASLSALYNWCREQKPPIYDGTNPVEGVERYEESEGRIRFLEWDEEAKLLEAAGEPLRTIALCGTDAGLRIKAEALTFRWSALDFPQGHPHRRERLREERQHARDSDDRQVEGSPRSAPLPRWQAGPRGARVRQPVEGALPVDPQYLPRGLRGGGPRRGRDAAHLTPHLREPARDERRGRANDSRAHGASPDRDDDSLHARLGRA